MARSRLCIIVISAILSLTQGIFLSTTPTTSALPSRPRNTDSTTPPPSALYLNDLRKRQDDESSQCGTLGSATWSCFNDLPCRATILSNGNAYVYCSSLRAVSPYIDTAAFGSWSTKSCPASTLCCSSTAPAVVTNYFISSDYTATRYECASQAKQVVWDPRTNLIELASFSASLHTATGGTSSSSLPPSSSSSSSSAAASSSSEPVPSIKTVTETSPSTPTSKNDSSGLSSSTQTAIGAGVGAGVGVILLLGLGFVFWRRRQKKNERLAEISPTQTSYSPMPPKSPPTPYSPPMSYNESQYKDQTGDARRSPTPEYSRFHEADASHASRGPIGGQPYELQGQTDGSRF